MEAPALARLVLVYAHLLLCVFALHLVLSTDHRVLRRHIRATRLLGVHRRVLRLLLGLWLTGIAIMLLDFGPQMAGVSERPKLLAKLMCVVVLSLNGLVLRYWSFPRLVSGRQLDRGEAAVLMSTGAISLASWLAAAFFGIARPLAEWPVAATVGLYGVLVAAAVTVALMLASRLRVRGPSGDTALEAAAETLDFKVR